MISKWQFPRLWTLSLNPRAYPDRRRILEWIKVRRCVSTWIQDLDRRKFLASRDWYVVMEFQMGQRNADGVGTEQAHFHCLVNQREYVLPHAVAWECWERKAPPWRACGEPCSRESPAMGFVSFDKLYNVEGAVAYLSKGVANYLAKGIRSLPDWYKRYLDEGHHMVLKYHSRGFFDSLPKPDRKYRREPVKRGARRSVDQRLALCRHGADVYIETDGDGDKRRVWLERCNWDWETTLDTLKMSDEQRAECLRDGRVFVTNEELVRVAGLPAYRRLLELNGGQPIGRRGRDELLGPFMDRIETEVQDRLEREGSQNGISSD